MAIGQPEDALRSCESDCLLQARPGSSCLIAEMARIHDQKIAICGDLEQIADSLPASIDTFGCLSVAERLLPILKQAHAFEEERIFPVYATLSPTSSLAASVERLRAEHIADECFADDLTEILLRVGHGEQLRDAETFGFMLRGFFDGLRRHIAFEHEHIAPIMKATGVNCPIAI